LLSDITKSRQEFVDMYVPELVRRAENRVKLEKVRQKKEVERLKKDLVRSGGDRPVRLDDNDEEEEEEEEDTY
jgi:hypothetical protein